MPTGKAGTSEVIMGGIGQLREFHLNITDWNIYKARLKNYFVANEVTSDNKKRAILLNMFDEESYKLIFNMCSPDVPELKTFDMLISLLDAHFIPRKSVLAERFKFFDSKKGNNETIKDWAARVRSLAVSCEFGKELDICLRDRFVCGFEKGVILDRLLEEKKDITFEQAIGIAENKMASSQSYQIGSPVKMEQLLHVRSHVNRHESQRHFNSQKGSSASATKGGTNDKCTTCGKTGHNHGHYNMDEFFERNPGRLVMKERDGATLGTVKIICSKH